jgi:hypothetical protein
MCQASQPSAGCAQGALLPVLIVAASGASIRQPDPA